jgi:rubrerythrin
MKMARNKQFIKIFEYALNQEKNGVSFFKNSLKQLQISSAKNAFKRLIEEEEKHIDFIERILKGLRAGPVLQTINVKDLSIKKRNFFGKKAKSEFQKQFKDDSMLPDVAIFNAAWLIERDISEFYTKMANQTGGEAKKAFEMLAKWEMGHEAFFREYRDKLLLMYSDMIQKV